MYTYSDEHKLFLRKKRREKRLIILIQIVILLSFIIIWELAAKFELINTFLYSSPSKVFQTVIKLYKSNDLLNHILVTLYEILISFSLASILGFIIASILWWNKLAAKVMDLYLTVINSLPKVALGPLIIIWVGASTKSIIVMALMISLILSILNIYNGFISTNNNFIKLMKTLGASKMQIFTKVIVPSNKETIINALKINISMSMTGVIMGELLVSRKGLGYLIMYGSQVFNINLVITSVVMLAILSYLIYYLICLIEKKLLK